MLASCPAVRELVVKFSCSAPPVVHGAPFQFQTERMPVQLAVEFPENVSMEVEFPKSRTLSDPRLRFPVLALKPSVESVPPLSVNADVAGKVLFAPSNKVPPLRRVVPVYVFAPASVKVPVPDLERLPVPEIGPEKV